MLPKKDKTTEERSIKSEMSDTSVLLQFSLQHINVEQRVITTWTTQATLKMTNQFQRGALRDSSDLLWWQSNRTNTIAPMAAQFWSHSRLLTLKQTDRQTDSLTDRQTAEQSSRYSAEEYLCARSVSSSSSWTCGGSGSSRLPWWENCPPVKP